MAQGWWPLKMHPVPGEVPEHWDLHLPSQEKARNKTYQEWGWNIFQAFENNSWIETRYVGLKDSFLDPHELYWACNVVRDESNKTHFASRLIQDYKQLPFRNTQVPLSLVFSSIRRSSKRIYKSLAFEFLIIQSLDPSHYGIIRSGCYIAPNQRQLVYVLGDGLALGALDGNLCSVYDREIFR
ncbi:hypothetical protein JHK82_012246 [Glycine max]|nr:hypothetical protein JHK82_012246 [Glycine max]